MNGPANVVSDPLPSHDTQNPPPATSNANSCSQEAPAQPLSMDPLTPGSTYILNRGTSFSDEHSMNQTRGEDAWSTGLDSQICASLSNADLDLNELESSMISFLNDPTSESYIRPIIDRTVYNNRLTELACSHKEDTVQKHWFTYLGPHDSGTSTPDTELGRTHVDEGYREELYLQLQPQVPNDPLPSTEFLVSPIAPFYRGDRSCIKNLCIRMYFTRFNPIFPIIHLPTFRLSKKSSSLLLSVCSIGSLLLGSDRAVMHGRNIFYRLSQAALVSVRYSPACPPAGRSIEMLTITDI